MSNNRTERSARAFQVVAQTIRSAEAQVTDHLKAFIGSTSNARIYVGILLICGARWASSVYLLFDQFNHAYTQYWNAYGFLYVLSGDIQNVVGFTGAYLLFSPANKIRYALLIPMISCFAHPFYLISIPTENLVVANRMVGELPGWYWFLLGIPMAAFWTYSFDWLMTLHYHKIMGTKARIEGTIMIWLKRKDIQDDKAKKILEHEWDLLQQYKSV